MKQRHCLAIAAALLTLNTCGALVGQAAGLPGEPHQFFRWQPFLAPFHSVVLHFPIGFLTMAGILEIYRAFRPSTDVRRIAVLILWLGMLTGVISASFGLMRAAEGGYDPKALELHRLYGLGVPVMTALCLALQWRAYRSAAGRGWGLIYRATLTGMLALVVIAGHYGGNLTHGSKYLVQNAPEFVREFLEPELVTPDQTGGPASSNNDDFYLGKVRPVLVAKCLKCHGPEKQKGGYRLDQTEAALKGGESGKVAIKPGDPLASHLVRLILLPPAHDDVMPPDGKEPLTPEELGVLLDWIRKGAEFPASAPIRATPVADKLPGKPQPSQ